MDSKARVLGPFSFGLYSSAMHGFIVDEIELGTRAAMAIDDEYVNGPDCLYWFFR